METFFSTQVRKEVGELGLGKGVAAHVSSRLGIGDDQHTLFDPGLQLFGGSERVVGTDPIVAPPASYRLLTPRMRRDTSDGEIDFDETLWGNSLV